MNKRQFFKNTYDFWSQTLKALFDLLKVLVFSSFKSSKLGKKKGNSQKCLILGNGPSLKEDMNEVIRIAKSTDIMALNFFCNSKEFFEIKPVHYCICDPRIFNSPEGFRLIPKRMQDFLVNFNEIDWDCTLYFPNHFKKEYVIDKLNNPRIRKIMYNSTPLESSSRLTHFLYRANLGMPRSESVIIPAIFISINLNFNKIYLYGVDHTWAKEIEVDDNNNSSFLLKHFWGNDKRSKSDRRISKFFESQYRLFNGHDQLERYAKSKNIKIINKTKASLIDSYVREY